MGETPNGPPLYIQDVAEFGSSGDAGNLVGVQPFMLPHDYATEGAFRAKLEGYLADAAARGWLNPRTIVAFPEHIGTWLAALGAGPRVLQAPTLDQAMRQLVLRRLPAFVPTLLRALAKSDAPDKIQYSLFAMRAHEMAQVYQETFSRLARGYEVSIVAGSIVLPAARIQDGVLRIGNGSLHNTSVVYDPAGRALSPPTRKAFPVTSELPFVTPATPSQLPVYSLPAGRLAVLICADAWYPEPYRVIAAQEADLLVVPSYSPGDGHWSAPWAGYDGAPPPPDVDPQDVGRLTEGQALEEALPGLAAGSFDSLLANTTSRRVRRFLAGLGQDLAG